MPHTPSWEPHPWELREVELDLEALARSESLFALSNGHLGLRGTLDEGEPRALPGTYLNGLYEELPLPHAEAGYGFPEDVETVVNATNGTLLRLVVDGEPFDVRTGELIAHRRVLDLRAGTLTREVEWRTESGTGVRVRSERLVSLTRRAVAAVLWEVEPLDADVHVVVHSNLVANEPLPDQPGADPRMAAALRDPLATEAATNEGRRALLVHRTKASGLRVAAGMDHLVDGPDDLSTGAEIDDDIGRLTIDGMVQLGSTLRVVKLLAYAWSGDTSAAELADEVDAALSAAVETAWDGLRDAQRGALDDFWECADVELDGDPELQLAVRFGLFQAFQAGAALERRGIPAKGLTGRGYDGHIFWDSETFVLPLLTYTAPAAAAAALQWRQEILPAARARATELRLRGAELPWRTIGGEECAAYWPAGTAAFHVAADVADAVVRYVHVTGDEAFDRDTAVELLVETGRLWRSLGHFNGSADFCIDGVTGPDEYSALADNNVYTNLMAQRNLRAAADAAERWPEVAAALDVDDAEIAEWRRAADAVTVPYDDDLGVHSQSERFTHYDEWDFERNDGASYPLLLNHHYFDLYRRQVVKQPDLVLAMHLCPDAFTDEEKVRNFDYYERRTVRDSSLSSCTHAVIAAEVGHLDLAYDHLGETAFMDLHDLHGNTSAGLHLAALGGSWIAVVAGFGGLRDQDGRLRFAPRLPSRLDAVRFRLTYRGSRLVVAIEREEGAGTRATYSVVDGGPVELHHHGEALRVEPGAPVHRTVPPSPERTPPPPPPGRTPRRKG